MSERIEVLPCPSSPKAIILLAHGLNNSACVLDEMSQVIDNNHSYLVKLRFSGHEQTKIQSQKDWASLWVQDMLEAIQRADELAKRHRAPLCFLGFSLGAIVFLNAIQKSGVRFDRLILFSPPLMISHKFRLIEILGYVGLFYVPSLNQPQYRAHRFLPISMYRSLFTLIRRLSDSNRSVLPTDGIIFIDPKDKLVSYELVKTWIEFHGISWSIVPIATKEKNWRAFRHLICVESNVETTSFKLMKKLVKTFIEFDR